MPPDQRPRQRPVAPPESGSEKEEVIADARRRLLVLAAMCIALVAVMASVTGLNVAQQALASDLRASQSELLWIINGYTLALAALLLPIGAIGDRWGRKPILLIGLVVLSLANVASAFAPSPHVLIALRVVAGIGAAMVMPVTLSVITTNFPREDQAKAIGAWAGFAGGGGIIGLFVSAAIVDNVSWAWIFAMPIGLAVTSFALTATVVPHSVEHPEGQFDIGGAVLSALAVGGAVLALHEGPERGWTDGFTAVAVVIAVMSTVAFITIELRREAPLLDLRIFAMRGLAAGSVNLFIVFGVMFGLFLMLVQYLQAVLGYSALTAASGLLPMAAVMMPLSTIAPTMAERVGFRRTLVIGMLLMAAGLVLLALLASADGGYLTILPAILTLGIGVGLAMSPSTAAITSSLPEEKQGVASALNDTVREMGGAVGIALLGSVLNASYRTNVEPITSQLPESVGGPVRDGIGGALAVAANAGETGTRLVEAARTAYVDGMAPALYLAAGICLLGSLYTALRGPTAEAQAAPQLDPADARRDPG